jgi:hypothetical protein
MSPEQFDQRPYDSKVDVFAYGTLLWELYSESVPLDGLEPQDIKKAVQGGRELPLSSNIPKPIQQIIKMCRAVHSSERPDFTKIQQLLQQSN